MLFRTCFSIRPLKASSVLRNTRLPRKQKKKLSERQLDSFYKLYCANASQRSASFVRPHKACWHADPSSMSISTHCLKEELLFSLHTHTGETFYAWCCLATVSIMVVSLVHSCFVCKETVFWNALALHNTFKLASFRVFFFLLSMQSLKWCLRTVTTLWWYSLLSFHRIRKWEWETGMYLYVFLMLNGSVLVSCIFYEEIFIILW